MGTQSQTEFIAQKKMLPPEPGRFQDREDLITYVRDFGADQGYVVTIKKSRKDRRVILGCDRGGVYRNRRKVDENRRKRKASSRLINCPFEAIGKKEDDIWTLTIKNGDHNHEPLKDMSEHPYSRRFTEDEVRQIKLMTEAGVKPRQVLKALKQHNPELQSTPRHLYNLKAKIRQGNLSEKSIKPWRPNISVSANNSHTFIGDSVEKNLLMKLPNFIGGEFLDSHDCSMVDVINPATQEVVSQVPLTTYEEFKAAVSAAKQAFPLWKNTPISTRRRIMFKFQELILRDVDKLAMNIVTEQGKTLKGAQGDVLHGLEVVEHTCGLATMQMGEFIPNASDGIDTYCLREPLGVCAGICAFNSLATISLWMFPVAVTCGNTFVLKPCEKNPGVSMLLAALAVEAGLPDGVLNIVHGTHDIINYICDDEDIKAVSFTGSNSVGTDVSARAAAAGKQVQSNTGGKNYAIIMPDANMEASLSALIAAGFGAAEQRCMALSTVVSIGSSIPWEEKVVEYAKVLKVDVGTDPNADLGPVITKEMKDRLCRLVHSSVESGARLLLDGRDIVVPGYENGNFIGPTILSDVTTDMECYKEEFLGPVLLFMQVDNLEEAISLVNRNKNKIGASIFTTSSMHARKFQSEVEVGMVGINVAVPVPLPSCSFNDKAGLEFYTQLKRVAQQCKNFPSIGVSLAVPSSSETDLRAQGVPWMLTSTSGQIILPPLPSASERDSPGIGVLHSNPPLSEIDLTNQRATSSSPSPSPSPDRGLSTYDSLSLMTRGHDSIVPSCTIDSSSERLYMLGTSHLNDSISQTLQRTDTFLFSSERLYMPPTSQRNDHIGLASQTNIALESTSDRIYLSSTSQRDDNMASATSQQAETLASTSKRIYIPPLVHRNAGMAPKSEWLCVPTSAASQRMYPRGPIISADEYPSQGASLTVPSSQRI